MIVAALFGGQGGPPPRVALEHAERSASMRRLLDVASRAAGVDLPALLARGGRDLERLDVLQAALVATALGVFASLPRRAAFVAGHSLGELGAWAATGGIDAEAAVQVAVERGRLMAAAAAAAPRPGGMAAVAQAPEPGSHAGVCLAACNAPDEWVLSGDVDALRALPGARPLAVAGAWHSPAMSSAVEPYRALLRRHARDVDAAAPRLVCNRTGDLAAPADLPDLLAGQLVHPVQWIRTLHTLAAHGVDTFVTVGPARALRSLVWRTLGPRTRVLTTETPAEVDRTVQELS